MPATFKDYYETLGVPRDASAADIKKAFRKLARKFHPDVAEDKASAEATFKAINEANEVLSDPDKRAKYDAMGANWQNPSASQSSQRTGPSGGAHAQEFNFGGTGFSDFFEQYFSGASRYGFPENAYSTGQSTAQGSHKGNDIEGDLLVTLEEAMHGALRSLSLQTTDPQTGQATTHTFQVRIPAGVTDGKRIRVPGEGEPARGGRQAGDLYLRVRHAAHPDFSTQGHDVFHELQISPWEAVLGAEISVPTLDGPVKLRIPPSTENGSQLRVKSRGLPKGKTGERGDFYAVISLQIPPTSTEEERALWTQLRDRSKFQPRNH